MDQVHYVDGIPKWFTYCLHWRNKRKWCRHRGHYVSIYGVHDACDFCGEKQEIKLILYDRDVLIRILTSHQRLDIDACYCGWYMPGSSHTQHIADKYEEFRWSTL